MVYDLTSFHLRRHVVGLHFLRTPNVHVIFFLAVLPLLSCLCFPPCIVLFLRDVTPPPLSILFFSYFRYTVL